jgi:hypothetical protein
MVARRHARRLEQCEDAAATLEPQASRSLLDGLETELLGVEGACPGEILRRESTGDMSSL